MYLDLNVSTKKSQRQKTKYGGKKQTLTTKKAVYFIISPGLFWNNFKHFTELKSSLSVVSLEVTF